MNLNNNSSNTNSPVQTPTGNRVVIQGNNNKTISTNIQDMKQAILPPIPAPQLQQLQLQQQQQQVQSQFEITSISCTTGNNENEEKSTRFRRVKIETEKNTEASHTNYNRGRWMVNDYYDGPDSINKTNDTTNEQVISTNNYTSTSKTQCKYLLVTFFQYSVSLCVKSLIHKILFK
jgi:hypothetical protein